MAIVYFSIALILGSLIFLGVYGFKTFKQVKPAINSLNQTMTNVQQKTDKIKKETTKLTLHQQQIMHDIDYKKSAFQNTISAGKQTITTIKNTVKLKPFSYVQGKNRFYNLKAKSRKRTMPTP